VSIAMQGPWSRDVRDPSGGNAVDVPAQGSRHLFRPIPLRAEQGVIVRPDPDKYPPDVLMKLSAAHPRPPTASQQTSSSRRCCGSIEPAVQR